MMAMWLRFAKFETEAVKSKRKAGLKTTSLVGIHVGFAAAAARGWDIKRGPCCFLFVERSPPRSPLQSIGER